VLAITAGIPECKVEGILELFISFLVLRYQKERQMEELFSIGKSVMFAYVPPYANSVGAECSSIAKANFWKNHIQMWLLKDLEPMRSNTSHLHNLIQHFYQQKMLVLLIVSESPTKSG
jgi:hypothetical protein